MPVGESSATQPPGRRSRAAIPALPPAGRQARAGYVVDPVAPLKRGVADKPGNMQWQKTAAAKAKDRIE
jgi:hypothetical protein